MLPPIVKAGFVKRLSQASGQLFPAMGTGFGPPPGEDQSSTLSLQSFDLLPQFRFFDLPIELRNEIYRYFVINPFVCQSHPRLWRPVGVDGGIFPIGYFNQDTVIPLLLTCHQIHDEAAAVLYGENTFAFHISELSAGPIAFLEWLAPQYVRLLRHVYIRTGYNVDTYGFEPESCFLAHNYKMPSWEQKHVRAARDLAISIPLIKHAWPAKYKVVINKEDTVLYSPNVDKDIVRRQKGVDWPASTYHLWKMFVTDTETENPKREFRRIRWEERSCDRL